MDIFIDKIYRYLSINLGLGPIYERVQFLAWPVLSTNIQNKFIDKSIDTQQLAVKTPKTLAS